VTKKSIALYLGVIGLLLLITLGWYAYAILASRQSEPASISTGIAYSETSIPPAPTTRPTVFDGQRAYQDVLAQVMFGPRHVGSEGHAQVREWIREELVRAGWQVDIQESEAMGHPIFNLLATRNDKSPEIILGAHYDTRLHADKDSDPDNSFKPVPGANDGASGVAVLLELARTLPSDTVNVWLAFFDAEDNGGIEGWDWILGSRKFVKNNPVQPRAVVIVDMIGDADLNIYKERNSDASLTDEIWNAAAGLGYRSLFIPEYKYSMLDDHIPFNEVGIPVVDIIDFDYPYHHTTQDTPDKVAIASLEAVGRTLWTWITKQRGN
jgi:hypothetical protein